MLGSLPDSHLSDVTLAILAGGEGSRMGRPKAQLSLGGKPILAYLLDQLAWPGPTLLVTAPGRERPAGCTLFSREVSDPHAGGGPLRGVLTALEHSRTLLLVVLTVDMPGIRQSQCAVVLDALDDDPFRLGAMMRRQCGQREQIEPFPLALRREALPIVAGRLEQGRRAVHGLLDEAEFRAIISPVDWDEKIWMNLNTPADINRFRP